MIKITAKPAATLTKTPLLILFGYKGKPVRLPAGVKVPPEFLRGFGGGDTDTAVTWAHDGPAGQVLLVGLGDRNSVDGETLRRAGARAARQAEALGAVRAVAWTRGLAKPAGGGESFGRALAEGIALGSYRFTAHKSAPESAKCQAVAIASSDIWVQKGVKDGALLAAACAYARELQNRPANDLTPTAMAAEARSLAKRSARITCKVLDKKAIAARRMGLLLSVSAGSAQPATLSHLVYKPARKAKGRVCLVGKGLTFDSGGISLKPGAGMDEMRFDMSGGAAVLGVFHALASLAVPYEVHGVIPSSENLLGPAAVKPGDIHTAMDGTTVQIDNTDAEGRLILADALCYAKKIIKPDTIIDLATLTGAVVMGLGHEITGIFPSTKTLRDELIAAGARTGEEVWPLPLLDAHKDAMKGKSADLTNLGPRSTGAGACTGAAFLAHFVPDDVAWCHMDIAGTAFGGTDRGWTGGPLSGTGVGTRLLMEWLRR